jgi:hypothetical protein
MAMLTDPTAEAAALLAREGDAGSLAECMRLISSQFIVIQTRSQVMLTLATITLTITGFSGTRIAGSGPLARDAMAIGLLFVLTAVVMVLVSLRVRWLTQFTGPDPLSVLSAIIAYRNAKTRQYLAELVLLSLGMGCYVLAMIAYLVQAGPMVG